MSKKTDHKKTDSKKADRADTTDHSKPIGVGSFVRSSDGSFAGTVEKIETREGQQVAQVVAPAVGGKAEGRWLLLEACEDCTPPPPANARVDESTSASSHPDAGKRSADPVCRITRPSRMARAFRRAAWRRITSE